MKLSGEALISRCGHMAVKINQYLCSMCVHIIGKAVNNRVTVILDLNAVNGTVRLELCYRPGQNMCPILCSLLLIHLNRVDLQVFTKL